MAPLTLQIGERRFTTTEPTLRDGGTYFQALFSGAWKAEQEADGSFFIDRDGEIFACILGFLRSGKYPLFYDDEKGFDHDRYLSLQLEAEYFGVDTLRLWIQGKKYEKVVEVRRQGYMGVGIDEIEGAIKAGDKHEYFADWETRKVYECPRGLDKHRGHQELCGRQCRNAQGDDGPEYSEERDLMMVEVRTCKSFNVALLTA